MTFIFWWGIIFVLQRLRQFFRNQHNSYWCTVGNIARAPAIKIIRTNLSAIKMIAWVLRDGIYNRKTLRTWARRAGVDLEVILRGGGGEFWKNIGFCNARANLFYKNIYFNKKNSVRGKRGEIATSPPLKSVTGEEVEKSSELSRSPLRRADNDPKREIVFRNVYTAKRRFPGVFPATSNPPCLFYGRLLLHGAFFVLSNPIVHPAPSQ